MTILSQFKIIIVFLILVLMIVGIAIILITGTSSQYNQLVTISRNGVFDEYYFTHLPSYPSDLVFTSDQKSLFVLCSTQHQCRNYLDLDNIGYSAKRRMDKNYPFENYLIKLSFPDLMVESRLTYKGQSIHGMALSSTNDQIAVLTSSKTQNTATITTYDVNSLEVFNKKSFTIYPEIMDRSSSLYRMTKTPKCIMKIFSFDSHWFILIDQAETKGCDLVILSEDFKFITSYSFPHENNIITDIVPHGKSGQMAIRYVTKDSHSEPLFSPVKFAIWIYNSDEVIECNNKIQPYFYINPFSYDSFCEKSAYSLDHIQWTLYFDRMGFPPQMFASNDMKMIPGFSANFNTCQLQFFPDSNYTILCTHSYNATAALDLNISTNDYVSHESLGALVFGATSGLCWWINCCGISPEKDYLVTAHASGLLYSWKINQNQIENKNWKLDSISYKNDAYQNNGFIDHHRLNFSEIVHDESEIYSGSEIKR